MRIFVACQQSPYDYPVPSYHFWRVYFYEGLTEAGHAMVEGSGVDWARGLLNLEPAERAQWKDETWSRTVAEVRRARDREGIDLFLTYLFPDQVEPSAVEEIRSLGIPCVNFFCDNVRNYRRLPDEFGAFDLHWVPEYAAQQQYRDRGWKFVHAPMPCWVPAHRRTTPSDENPVVSFVGRCDRMRAQLLAHAIEEGLPIEIRGPGWESASTDPSVATKSAPSAGARIADWRLVLRRQGLLAAWRRATSRFRYRAPLRFDFSPYSSPNAPMALYMDVVAKSAVNLGINRFPSLLHSERRPGTYSRLRDIEAPMLGACYLTEWTEGLDSLYEPGKEIETFRDAVEMVTKSRELLSNPAHRRELRISGQRRALDDHSVGQSLLRIAEALDL